jgi:hypothetical protein
MRPQGSSTPQGLSRAAAKADLSREAQGRRALGWAQEASESVIAVEQARIAAG